MDFRDTPNEAAFRATVREFIKTRWPSKGGAAPAGEVPKVAERQWREALRERQWIAPAWPREHGGGGLTPAEMFIFNEEMAKGDTPQVGDVGVPIIGPALIVHGTDAQKAAHLPRIAAGEEAWCQGYSEPGAGSDMAALQTRAVRDGDEYLVNGQKIWSSRAHWADWMMLLVRTDPAAPKHRGISMLMLDLKTPGVTVRPLVDLAGFHEFNEVYFDDVRIPTSNRVGDENRGWYVATAALDSERSNIRAAIAVHQTVLELVEFARQRPPLYDVLRHELADRCIEAEIGRLISAHIISLQKRGQNSGRVASVNKLYRSELTQRVARTGIKLAGLAGNAIGAGPGSVLHGRLPTAYLKSVSATIGGGTSEIQRNVIATRGLDLPRD